MGRGKGRVVFFAGESVPVNQGLSDMLLQLHISERTGRGVPKITEVYGRETYEFRENSIVVTIPLTRVVTEGITQVNTQDDGEITLDRASITSVTTPVEAKITLVDSMFATGKNKWSIEERILEFCKVPKGIIEISEMLNYKTKKTARKYVKNLVDIGRLAMTVPDKPNSKLQKYITIK